MSVVEIIVLDIYDDDGYLIEGGLMDKCFGVIDLGFCCEICGVRVGECLGYFGYIEFVRLVIYVGFVKIIYCVLESMCCECGRIKFIDEEIEEYM